MRRRNRSRDPSKALVAAQVSVPRLQMSLLVLLTAATGFLASVALSLAGMDALWLRYPLCVVIAYAAFLGLIWAWRRRREWELPTDAPGGGGSSPPSQGQADWQGGGGSSGGGGASAAFDAPYPATAFDPTPAPLDAPSLDAVLDVDEGLPVVLVAVLLAGALLAVGWVIWIAPALLAELALDAVLSAGLYRRLKRSPDGAHWLGTTLRHTGRPFLAATFSLLIAGILMSLLVPGATSLGEFLAHYR
jgi:membrane protein YdbS with pleckstrin-like domain